jgi:pyrroline-5-carboxylate reductase
MAEGLEEWKGRAYIAALSAGVAQRAQAGGTVSFRTLSREFATRGGLNEQVLTDSRQAADENR